MPTSPALKRQTRALEVIDRLDAAMPEAKIELNYHSPFELLVAVLLSAQCTDRRVNMVTPELFKRFPDPASYTGVSAPEVEHFIKTLGLFRNKAKALVKLGPALVEQHEGQVPTSREALAALPGVGNKTAGVVAMHLGEDLAFPVDTHVMRLARRLGFTRQQTPDKIEAALQQLLPPKRWFQAHQLLVWHGRRVCHALKPECERCVVAPLCPKTGVTATRRSRPVTRRRRPGPHGRP